MLDDLKWFQPSAEQTPTMVRLLDLLALIGAVAFGASLTVVAAWLVDVLRVVQ